MRRLIVLAVSTLLLAIPPADAQETTIPDPLLDMLAYVPDNADVRSNSIAYQNLNAALNSRPYFSGIVDAESLVDQERMVWTRFLDRLLHLPSYAAQALARPDWLMAVPETTGINLLDIDATLSFGPVETVWRGDFDIGEVESVHQARGYQPAPDGELNAWCGRAGCVKDVAANESDPPTILNDGNGRQWPLLIPDEVTIVTSPSFETLQQSAGAYSGAIPSLADAPDYRALAEAITDPEIYTGDLVGAFFPQLGLVMSPPMAFDETMLSADQTTPGAPTPSPLMAEFGVLPPYFNAVIADRQEGEMQVAVVALVYTDAATAESAAAELARRLELYSRGLQNRHPDEPPLFSRFNGEAYTQSRVYSPDGSEVHIAVAEVWYPALTPEEELVSRLGNPDPPRLPPFPAAYYKWLIEGASTVFFYPLWVELPAS